MNKEPNSLILESDKPLSQSMIWRLQSEFYSKQGPDAWSKGIVPQYITTNPYFAKLYAKTVFAYCRDLSSRQDLKDDSTLYILELAAGVGRFTYTFLTQFNALLENAPFHTIKIKYIVSDFAMQNVDYYQKHPSLKPFFESGILDCAQFDMTNDSSLQLLYSGEQLNPCTLSNPLVLLANYTFDSLPQDTFYVNNGVLYEGLLSLSKKSSENTTEEKNTSKPDSILSDISYEYNDRSVDGAHYYDEIVFNELLLNYQASLEEGSFSMPIIAFRCIQRLKKLFENDIVLITADKGYNNLNSMQNTYHPVLSQHGSISLMVNFHAFELFFKTLGGSAHHSVYEHENITLSLFTIGNAHSDFSETTFMFKEIVEEIGPDDFHAIKKAIIPLQKSMTTKELLTFLKYTLWDSRTFLELYNTLLERVSEEENFPVIDLINALYKVWGNYFPIGEEGDLSYCLGTFFAYFGYDHEAIKLFQTSIQFYGESPDLLYEIALCYYNLHDFETAMNFIDCSLKLDAAYEEAVYLKSVLNDLAQ